VVGAGADNTDVDAVALIPAGKSIYNVDAIPRVEVVDSTLTVNSPDLECSQLVLAYLNDVIVSCDLEAILRGNAAESWRAIGKKRNSKKLKKISK
jgi:hypothetical protein